MLSGVPAPTIQHSQMASSTLCPILQGASYEAQPVWHRQQSVGYLHPPSNIPRWPAALCVQFCKELHMKHSPYGTANSQGGSVGTQTVSHATFMHRELHMKHSPYGTANSQGGSVGTETVATAHIMLSGVPAPTIQHSQMASSTLCPILQGASYEAQPVWHCQQSGWFRGHSNSVHATFMHRCNILSANIHSVHSCCRELHMKHSPYGTANIRVGPWALKQWPLAHIMLSGVPAPNINIPRWPAALCVQFCKELHMKHSPYGTANSQGGSGASYEAQPVWQPPTVRVVGYLHPPSNIPRWPAALCVQFCKELHMKHSPYGTANSQGGSVGTQTVSMRHSCIGGNILSATFTLCTVLQGASYEAQPVWHRQQSGWGASYEAQPVWHRQQSGWFRGHSNSVPCDIHASVQHPERKTFTLCTVLQGASYEAQPVWHRQQSGVGPVGTETVATAHIMLSGVPATHHPTFPDGQQHSVSNFGKELHMKHSPYAPANSQVGYLHPPSNIPRWPAALCVQFCKELHMKHSPYGTANSQVGYLHPPSNIPRWPAALCVQFCKELHMKHSPYGTANSQGGSVGTQTVSHATFMHRELHMKHSPYGTANSQVGYLHPPSNIPRWPAALCVQFCKELHMKHSPYGTANSQGGSVGTETVATAHIMLSGVPAPTIQHSRWPAALCVQFCKELHMKHSPYGTANSQGGSGASYEAQPVWHRQQSGWWGYLHPPSNIPRWPAALCVQFCKELHMKHSPYGTANSQGGGVPAPTIQHSQMASSTLCPILQGASYEAQPVWHRQQSGWWGTCTHHPTFPDGQQQLCVQFCKELHMKHSPYGTANSQGGSVGTETVSTAHFMLSGVPAPTIQHSQMASSTLCPILQGASYEAQPVWHCQQSGWFRGHSNSVPCDIHASCCRELHMKHSPYGTANSQVGYLPPTIQHSQMASQHSVSNLQGASYEAQPVWHRQQSGGVPAPTIQHSQMASSTLCPILQGASYEAQPVWHRQQSGGVPATHHPTFPDGQQHTRVQFCKELHMKHSPYGTANSQGGSVGTENSVHCTFHAQWGTCNPPSNIPRWPAALCVQFCKELHMKHSPYGTANSQGGSGASYEATARMAPPTVRVVGYHAPTIQHSQMASSTLVSNLQGASYEAQPVWHRQQSGWWGTCTHHPTFPDGQQHSVSNLQGASYEAQPVWHRQQSGWWGTCTHHPNIPRWPSALCVQFCKELHMKHSPYGTANSQGGGSGASYEAQPVWHRQQSGGSVGTETVATAHIMLSGVHLHPPSNFPDGQQHSVSNFARAHMKHSPYGTANSQGGSGASYEAQPVWHRQQSGGVPAPTIPNIPRWPAALCVQFCKELHMKHSPYGTANSQGGSGASYDTARMAPPTVRWGTCTHHPTFPDGQQHSVSNFARSLYEAQPVWHCQQSGWFRGHSNSVPCDIHASVQHPERKHSLCAQCCRELHMKHSPYGTATVRVVGYLHPPSNIPRWPAALCVQFSKELHMKHSPMALPTVRVVPELHMKHSPYGTANSQGGSVGTQTVSHATFMHHRLQHPERKHSLCAQCCRELHMKHSPYGTTNSQVVGYLHPPSNIPDGHSTLCPILQGAHMKHSPYGTANSQGGSVGTQTVSHATFMHRCNILSANNSLCAQCCRELHMKHSPYGTANSQWGTCTHHPTFPDGQQHSVSNFARSLHVKHSPYGNRQQSGGVPAPTIQLPDGQQHSVSILQGASYEAQPVWHRQQSGW
ncbi:hypothetical protein BKA70DRAFT_1235294, partial [Coprinopsis sp. MPI-PUGE-AT-0042]